MSDKLKTSKLNSYKLHNMIRKKFNGKEIANELYESFLSLKYK